MIQKKLSREEWRDICRTIGCPNGMTYDRTAEEEVFMAQLEQDLLDQGMKYEPLKVGKQYTMVFNGHAFVRTDGD